jgi:hypothetical protein
MMDRAVGTEDATRARRHTSNSRMRRGALFFLLFTCAWAQERPIDTARSRITIHVGKTGLLSSAAHEHWVSAPISEGVIREAPDPRVAFKIRAEQLAVRPDPEVDPRTQAQIQKDMQEITLEVKRFPRIEFHSTHVERDGAGWRVTGDLLLHGVTRAVTVTVQKNNDAFLAHTVLKQTDFGIRPISVGHGMIKVRNEIEIDFEIFMRGL